ncbi:MAG: phosphatidylethanolamine N-methyltransferase family protein [Vicinamibacterales bacterium]|jgi:protein-S-isoprenylcysteine O-methyltransferase Ste14|nr:hypothetical protein [Acidobacteriota bacterium]MDP7294249.1 phosphatidylethanolamine N-methyltransferase family protein [Vicinamibacterales bacterium]MDP7472398.1 phosphatidylethanolamine N-methyltransferase family protein [Vicinamibacterales bacterium]MDP7670406.1 phosphatidylethanolamine N-methyltransferase family protein [Vicinamibacterales bacterium]HJO38064.1 PEMT/PEM2 methyltransferase family protein [Vicinamibacterales bacterium]|tara:strand:+ start:3994 stop:4695 length:702 start_codon:yes stop_codon:yes gene_type:complete
MPGQSDGWRLLSRIFERQWLHLLLLIGLLGAMAPALRADPVRLGTLGGLGTPVWIALAIIVAVSHQCYVWFCWRMQLHGQLFTRLYGDRGFPMYGAGFAALALARLATVVAVAASNRDTLPWDPTMLRLLAVAAAVPVVYLFHSIQRYFTFRRALGIDHFDPSYRSRPLVRQGIFRYTRNAMYVFGFLMAWIPGLWFGSAAGLVVALFSHAYIWVHYIATERPDMRRIYSQSA